MLRCYINCEHLIILTCKSGSKTIVLRFFINCQLHSCAKHTINYTCYKCVVVMCIYIYIYIYMGTAVAQWLRCCATNRKVAGSIPASVRGFFVDIKSFRSHYGPGVDSAFNRNEYQEHFLGGKGGRRVGLTTLPPSCAVVTKSGNLNFLEPSGPFQACNGTTLPLYIYIFLLLMYCIVT